MTSCSVTDGAQQAHSSRVEHSVRASASLPPTEPHSRSSRGTWSRSDPPSPLPSTPPSSDGVSQALDCPAPSFQAVALPGTGRGGGLRLGDTVSGGAMGFTPTPGTGDGGPREGRSGPAPSAEESQAQGSRFLGRLCRQPGWEGPGSEGRVWGEV